MPAPPPETAIDDALENLSLLSRNVLLVHCNILSSTYNHCRYSVDLLILRRAGYRYSNGPNRYFVTLLESRGCCTQLLYELVVTVRTVRFGRPKRS
jgi:hypothetical protein